MEDRYKFRAWLIKEEAMVDVEVIEWGSLDQSNPHGFIGCPYEQGFNLNEETGEKNCVFGLEGVRLMQCTGLKDKNGKLIYEGDILKDSSGNIRAVKWVDYDTEEDFGSGMTVIGWNIVRYTDYPPKKLTYEIIGNIYENPELLDQCK